MQLLLPGQLYWAPESAQSLPAPCTSITRTTLSKSLPFPKAMGNLVTLMVQEASQDAEERSGLLRTHLRH